MSGPAVTPALAAPQLLAGVRRSLGLGLEDLAARLGIPPALAAAFEAGRLHSLPPWPQTADIVQRWIALAGIDPAPALNEFGHAFTAAQPARTDRAIMDGLAPLRTRPQRATPPADPAPLADAARAARDDTEARIAAVARVLGRQASPAPPSHAAPTPPLQPAGHDASEVAPSTDDRLTHRLAHWRERWRRGWPKAGAGADELPLAERPRGVGRPWRLASAAVLLLFMLGSAAFNTSVRAAAVSALPEPAGRAVRSFSDFLAEYFAPVREGHRWIDVADPRSRRGDKLRVHTRLD